MSNDIAISPAGALLDKGPAVRTGPTHLIIFDEKKPTYAFIAIKLEPESSFIKAWGIHVNMDEIDLGTIGENFSYFLSKAEKNKFVELLIPWHKVSYIRNLIFRQK